MMLFYQLFTALAMLVLAPYYALRGWRRGEPLQTLRERLGRVPDGIVKACVGGGAIWIHAVSVGEVLAAQPIVAQLKQQYPERPVFVSTTTETGQRLARERLKSASGIFYFPLDSSGAVRRALRTICPAIVIIMETEIWPNFLREAYEAHVPVVFANARISKRSFARYRRWEFLLEDFFTEALHCAVLFLAQTQEDAGRLIEMGAFDERVVVTGNLKYDASPPALGQFGVWLAEQIKAQDRWPVVVAGSVVSGEEEAVLAAYDAVQRQWRRALMILAPRKPDRFDEASRLASEAGWNVTRRSRLDLAKPLDENTDVLVLDSIGELSAIYSLADAAFVGGSLVTSGGHNILEPAWFGRPPVFGRSMENFSEMAEQFLGANAGVQVSNGAQLGKVWVQLIENDALRERMGRAARELSARNAGATSRTLERIRAILGAQQGSAA
ncbi:MAG TPA: 3-deoxy-D-manno-octulosonic acid transferase [Candidatus Acidoferrales bacterium]|nr:3-deoxy-D-manno-octulosonic acid transferase [Candidatus Acidoferrales bacterium]